MNGKIGEQLTLKETQQVGLSILEKVHLFCVNNGIRYSITYGTLIGAVRHKGFIPWDDDIDVIMPKKEYVFFCIKFKNNNDFKLLIPGEKDYFYPFAKLVNTKVKILENGRRGNMFAFIDIFPLDSYSEKAISKTKRIRRRLLVNGQNLPQYPNYISNYKAIFLHKMYYFLEWFFCRFFLSNKNLNRELLNVVRKNQGSLFGCIVWPQSEPVLRLGNIFEQPECYLSFEGITCKVCYNYEYVLTVMYGNYMVPPKTIPQNTHDFVIIDDYE